MFKRRNPLTMMGQLRQFLWPRTGWRRAFLYMGRRVVRMPDSTHAISLGLAAGAFSSAFPILGTHILIAALIAWLVGGNIIASALGTWAGNPLTFPFIWLGSFHSGNFLLGRDEAGALPSLNWRFLVDTPWESITPVLTPMLVGTVPIGLAMAVPSYFISHWVISYYQKKRQQRRAKVKHRDRT